MSTCPYCGCELDDGANFCASCGSELEIETEMDTYEYPSSGRKASSDKGGFWWGVLGCCIPLVGLIMYFVWNSSKPKTAKALGTGALVGAIIGVLFFLGVFGLGAALVSQIVGYLMQ